MTNPFMVAWLDGTIHAAALSPRRLARHEALNLAAWLVALADEPVAFDQVTARVTALDNPHMDVECVLSVEFVQLVELAQREARR